AAGCKVKQRDGKRGVEKKFHSYGVQATLYLDEKGNEVSEYLTYWVQYSDGWTMIKGGDNTWKSTRTAFNLARRGEAAIAAEVREQVYVNSALKNTLTERVRVGKD